MNQELIVGLVALGVPFFSAGYLMLRKQPGIFRMFMAMLLIGLGYLTATGAINDIGAKVLGHKAMELPPEPAAAPATAPAPAPAPAPATP
jgi:hypothetical protein